MAYMAGAWVIAYGMGGFLGYYTIDFNVWAWVAIALWVFCK